PNRHDALERLDTCAAQGAVLVKWIPSVMHIDPADERLIPFYERLKHHRLPLLTHTGQERSFTHAQDDLCDPERLRLPLRLGVTVIAAHIASTGTIDGERHTDRLARMMAEYPNLHSEISSLTQANKPGYLGEALTRPEFEGRLCYGSDFPLINTALVSPWLFAHRLTPAQMHHIDGLTNAWDRDIALKQALGVPPEVFSRTARLLAPRLPAGWGAPAHGSKSLGQFYALSGGTLDRGNPRGECAGAAATHPCRWGSAVSGGRYVAARIGFFVEPGQDFYSETYNTNLTRAADVRDGMSNVFMLGEWNAENWLDKGPWYGGSELKSCLANAQIKPNSILTVRPGYSGSASAQMANQWGFS
ncbi:MAG: hypothetical protein EBU81_15090, partial [Proteobacteria bacterium]|nr:hypothetical protein [Pseudomonadota bacterium]